MLNATCVRNNTKIRTEAIEINTFPYSQKTEVGKEFIPLPSALLRGPGSSVVPCLQADQVTFSFVTAFLDSIA